MNLLKYLSKPASIYLLEIKNGNTRRSMHEVSSKCRCIFRTQLNILAFGCQLSLQKSSIVDVQLGCKDASKVKDEDTRTT